MIAREVQPTTQAAGVPGREHVTVVETEPDGEVVRSDCGLPIPAWRPGDVSVRLA